MAVFAPILMVDHSVLPPAPRSLPLSACVVQETHAMLGVLLSCLGSRLFPFRRREP